jgi:hypothetical protein
VLDAVEEDRGRAIPEGVAAGRGVARGQAEREDVDGRDGGGVDPDLLGRHVRRRADARVGAGQRRGLGGPRDPEVDDGRAVRRHQHVSRLEVAVDDAGGVDGLQGGGDARHQAQGGGRRQWPAVGHGAGERLARDVLGGQPRHGAVGVAVDDGDHVTPAHAPGGAHLLLEPPPELRVLGEVVVDRLEGDRQPAARGGEIHRPHPARAQPPLENVTRYVMRISRSQRPNPRHAVASSARARLSPLRTVITV